MRKVKKDLSEKGGGKKKKIKKGEKVAIIGNSEVKER